SRDAGRASGRGVPFWRGSVGLFSARARVGSGSCGGPLAAVQLFLVAAVLLVAAPAGSAEPPVKVVVLGDSLTAGFNLPASAAFPARLEQALRAKGHAVEIANAGVSGDTASGGLARLDWSVPPGTEAVIVELRANDTP